MKLHLSPGVLQTPRVQLEPYEDGLKEDVRAALNCDPEGWQLFAMSGQGDHFDSWWDSIMGQVSAGTWVAYAIRDRSSGVIVGTSSFMNIKPDRLCVEIGATFLHPRIRSTYVNPDAKLTMLEYAFGQGARRVELLTDLRNKRSQAAIAKLGAVREGVLRRDRETWTNHIRDSVLYSITDLDWPAVQQKLRARKACLG